MKFFLYLFLLFPVLLSAQESAEQAVPLNINAVVGQERELSVSDKLIQGILSAKNLLLRYLDKHTQHVFSLNDVNIVGNSKLSREEILRHIQFSTGIKNSFFSWFFPLENIAYKLEEQAWIKSSSVQWYIYPLRLSISIQEEEPWMIARYKGSSWLISKNGNLLQSLENIADTEQILEMSSLPRIEGLSFSEDEVLRFFSSERERFNYAVKQVKLVNEEMDGRLKVAIYELLDDGSMKLEPANPMEFPKLFFRFERRIELSNLLDLYFSTLSDLESRNEKASEIDLRFSNQVIVR